MVTFVTNFREASFRQTLQKASDLIQPDSPFLQRIRKIQSVVINNILVTGEEICQLFQQKIPMKFEVYFPMNSYQEALGYEIEEEYTSENGQIVHLNGSRLLYCESEIIATMIHETMINLIIHAEGSFFKSLATPTQEANQKEPLRYSLDDINDERGGFDLQKPFAYGTFVFRNNKGTEVPRNVMYNFLRKEVRKQLCCCFPFF